jgi:hypothetical protein
MISKEIGFNLQNRYRNILTLSLTLRMRQHHLPSQVKRRAVETAKTRNSTIQNKLFTPIICSFSRFSV